MDIPFSIKAISGEILTVTGRKVVVLKKRVNVF
jgi:hypothetical protein